MEKILIESKNTYVEIVKKIMVITFIIAIVGFILGQVFQNKGSAYFSKALAISNRNSFKYYEEDSADYKEYEQYQSKSRTFYNLATKGTGTGIICGVVFFFFLGTILYSRKMKIIVTDKRVYGQASFGRQVDLPFDSISAIGKWSLKGIVVATSSGKIRFMLISNRDDIYKIISNLLITRQDKKQVVNNSSNVEELTKYKELLDNGVITQEEFNAKKKQLLGI